MSEQRDGFDQWAILELMGHRRLGGRVREEVIAGVSFVRIDVPATKGQAEFTQFYSPGSVYCLTPSSEEMARAIAEQVRHVPVSPYEMPQRPQLRGGDDGEY